MIENFIFSAGSVLPIFLVLALGYIIRLRGWTDGASLKRMNTVIFNLGLPVLMFRDVSNSNIDELFDAAFVAYCIVTTALIFIITLTLSNAYFKNRKVAGTFSQACFRSNYAILGLSLINHILGDAHTGLGVVPLTFVLPFFNVFTIIALAANENKRGLAFILAMLKDIFKTPITIGILAGIVFSLLGISLPELMGTPVNQIASMTPPLALLIVGGSIDFSGIRSRYKPALAAAVVKLVVTPLIFVPVAVWIGFGSEAVLVLYVMYGTPTAVASYAFACNLGGDEELALNSIVLTTVLSVFTFTIGLFLLRTLAII